MIFGSKKKKNPAKKKKPAKKKDGSNKDDADAEEAEMFVKEETVAAEEAAAMDEAAIGEPSVNLQPTQDVPEPILSSGAQQPAAQQTGNARQMTATIVEGPPAEEISVDGVSSLSWRSGVVKLACYRVVGHDSQANRESRMVTLRLVMPATALQELKQILQNVSELQQAQADKVGTEETD